MSRETTPQLQSIVVEREIRHPPEKVWRALTESELIASWLMPNDFWAEVGHRFTFRTRPASRLRRNRALRSSNRRTESAALLFLVRRLTGTTRLWSRA